LYYSMFGVEGGFLVTGGLNRSLQENHTSRLHEGDGHKKYKLLPLLFCEDTSNGSYGYKIFLLFCD
jgi:hypothetical protein